MMRPKRIHQRLKPLTILITLALVIAFSSCQREEVYFQYYELEGANWSKDNVLTFDVSADLLAKDSLYEVSVELVNSVSYPYRNLWLYVDTNIKSDTVFTRKEVEAKVADNKGNWLGDGFGSLYALSVPILVRQKSEEGRSYSVYVQHGMTDKSLKGIEKVGLRVRKLSK